MKEPRDRETPARLLRFAEVKPRIGNLARSTVWRLEKARKFPAHRQISANAVGWLESEIEEWIAERLAAPRTGRQREQQDSSSAPEDVA